MQTRTNIELKLEIVHNKKNIIQDDRRKEAQSLYKSRYYKDENEVF